MKCSNSLRLHRKRTLITGCMLLLTFALPACLVSQSRYDELAGELDSTRTELEKRERELVTVVNERAALRESVDEMSEALAQMRARNAAAQERIEEFRRLLAKFKSLIDAGKLQIKIQDGRMVVVLPSDVLFKSGDANLSPDGIRTIQEITTVLITIEERKFQIEGHTDDVPIKTYRFPSNWELAAARAVSVIDTMVDAGMPRDRLSAASFADIRPVASNDNEEGRRQNRRIEIVVVPDLSDLPGFEELNKISEEQEADAAP